MTASQSSTLFATEGALRPLTYAIVAVSAGTCVAILLASRPHLPVLIWAASCTLSAIALGSNFQFLLTHQGRTTFGMIPVALVGILPAALTGASVPSEPLHAVSVVASIALGALAAFFAFWFLRLWSAYHPTREVTATAALIVLGGAIKQGRPCHTLRLRLDTASQLWHEEPSRTIVVSGGPTPDGSTTEADAMKCYLEDCGVAQESILAERHARNTKENIRLSCELLDDRGFAGQYCVISSNYHLYRALRDARAIGRDFCPIAAPTPRRSILQQWSREVLTVIFER